MSYLGTYVDVDFKVVRILIHPSYYYFDISWQIMSIEHPKNLGTDLSVAQKFTILVAVVKLTTNIRQKSQKYFSFPLLSHSSHCMCVCMYVFYF